MTTGDERQTSLDKTRDIDDVKQANAVKGEPGRVAVMHARTRDGLMITTVFVILSTVFSVVGNKIGWWVPLHFFVVGALLSAISNVTQMLSVTWSTSPPPHAKAVIGQRHLLTCGALLVVSGRYFNIEWLFIVGGVFVIVAMFVLAVLLIQIRARAQTDRYAPAIESYVLAVVAGAVGMSIGVVIGTNHYGELLVELRGAHLTLNLFGLVGLVIVGTIPFFMATQVRSKMSSRATPVVLRSLLVVLTIALLVSVLGQLSANSFFVRTGLIVYAFGLASLFVVIPFSPKCRRRYLEPRVLQVTTGLIWWAVMMVVLGCAYPNWGNEVLAIRTLVLGGFTQILFGSLAYLGPVVRGGGYKMLTPGFKLTNSWISLVVGNLAAVASIVNNVTILKILIVVWIIDFVVRATVLISKKKPVEKESVNNE